MPHLFDIPEAVMTQCLLPYLKHNDILRLRRVCKKTKAFADAYLWTPKPGHQGKWELKIDSSQEEQTLEAFLKLGLPPPSRLHVYIVNKAEDKPSLQSSFFEDKYCKEFMERYSKYVTDLRVDKLYIPFTCAKEIGFYESLVNLKVLRCGKIITVGGADQFREKARNAEGSFLIRPTFKKLRSLTICDTDCLDSMYNFINGVFNNLEELKHPIRQERNNIDNNMLVPVRQLIERRHRKSHEAKLVYDWTLLSHNLDTRPYDLELLRIFAGCRDNGVLIKNLNARYLDCLLFDGSRRIGIREIVNRRTMEWMWSSRANCERNLFVGDIIQSLLGVTANAFLMEMPALETFSVFNPNPYRCHVYRRSGHDYPRWPNLKKMDVELDDFFNTFHDFLWGQGKRPTVEELRLYQFKRNQQCLRMMRLSCCDNLKKLTLSFCSVEDDIFVGLWEGLTLLEEVIIVTCDMLTNKGFVGNGVDKSRPVFLKLKKLKHLTLLGLHRMTKITDEVFWDVFRHLELFTLKLQSSAAITSVTLEGIKGLLTGRFAETIEKLDLNYLTLKDVSEEELNKVVSCSRCSKML